MNKKLIALAVAGACAAPAAMAQTANPVTLYGRAYVTLESVEAKGGASLPRRTRVEDQSSLFGIRGTEDLGAGLKAFFQLETAFRLDSNNTAFATRNSGVGLQGGWGSVVMGRWDTPYKITTYSIDLYGDLTNGGITGVLHDRGNFDRREQNVIQYWTPNFGGFAARLSYSANEGKTSTLNPRVYSGNVTYTRGPFYVFYAYEEHKDVSATLKEEEGNSLGGYVNFGPVKVGAVYETIEKTGSTKKKGWLASVAYNFGKHRVGAQFMNAKDGGATTATLQPECDSVSASYWYTFTKRTFFIAQYIDVDNNAAATCNFGANGLTISAGQDPKGISLGIQHVF